MNHFLSVLFSLLLFSGCAALQPTPTPPPPPSEVATFAGGCFWAMQPPFDHLDGIHSIRVGYMGGTEEFPMFDEVTSGNTSHLEVIQIEFNPDVISYRDLLHVFWRNIDPTDDEGQFADRGPNYRTAIFFHSEAQRQAAAQSRDELARQSIFSSPIVTSIRAASTFWQETPYHHDYYKKKPDHFNRYLRASGRPAFLQSTWGLTAHQE